MSNANRPFLINEGAFTVPEGFQDRSTNVFIQGDPASSLLNINIGRDQRGDEEAIDAYVTRQIKILTEKLPGYKLKERKAVQLGMNKTDHPITGEQIDAGYKSNGRFLHQRQAAFPMPGTLVLIFSATSGKPFDDEFEKMWEQWLGSFEIRPDNDGIKQ